MYFQRPLCLNGCDVKENIDGFTDAEKGKFGNKEIKKIIVDMRKGKLQGEKALAAAYSKLPKDPQFIVYDVIQNSIEVRQDPKLFEEYAITFAREFLVDGRYVDDFDLMVERCRKAEVAILKI